MVTVTPTMFTMMMPIALMTIRRRMMTIRRMMMTIRRRMMTIRRRMMTIRRKMMTNRNGRPPKTDRTAIAQSREGENDRLFPLQYIQLRPPYSYFDHQSFPENFCHRMKRFKKHPFNLCTFITSKVAIICHQRT